MVKEDEVKQTIFQKIFDKNPLLEWKDSERSQQHLVNPEDSIWTHFGKTNPLSSATLDPANNIRDQIQTDLWQWYALIIFFLIASILLSGPRGDS